MAQAAQRAKKKSSNAAAKTYRFDARLNEDQKLLIQRAADFEGRTMTDFVLHSAEAAAEKTKHDEELQKTAERRQKNAAAQAKPDLPAAQKPADPGQASPPKQ